MATQRAPATVRWWLGLVLVASVPLALFSGRSTALAAISPAARNAVYCTAANDPNNTQLLMDVYTPGGTLTPPPQPRPGIVAVHGGGWHNGDKTDVTTDPSLPLLLQLLANNYVVFAINYRLAPAYVHPAQIEDVKCAIRSVKANANQWGIDPGRVAIWGGSAGGHLAALAATAGPSAGWDVGEYLTQSSGVRAVVDWSGPADLWAEYNEALADLSWDPQAQEVVTWVPIVFGSTQSSMLAASPVTFVAPGDPPFVIQHGTLDLKVFPDQSQELANALQLAGVTVHLIWVQNAGHGFVSANGLPIYPSLSQIAFEDILFLQANNPGP